MMNNEKHLFSSIPVPNQIYTYEATQTTNSIKAKTIPSIDEHQSKISEAIGNIDERISLEPIASVQTGATKCVEQ